MSIASRSVGWSVAAVLAGVLPVQAQAVHVKRVELPHHRIEVWGGGAHLGVTLEDVNAGDAEPLGLDSPRGARVDTVVDSSPAEKAGLREGDVIVGFDGERVRSAAQLARVVRETPPGRAVEIEVLRAGGRQTLTAELGERGGPLLPEHTALPPGVLHWEPRDGGRFDFDFDPEHLRDFGREWRDRTERSPRFWFGRGRLGIRYQELGEQLASYLEAGDGGVLVVHVEPDSPAERAGLKAGDVVQRIGDRDIREGRDLRRALREADDGATLAVTVSRRGAVRELEVVLDDGAEGKKKRETPPAAEVL